MAFTLKFGALADPFSHQISAQSMRVPGVYAEEVRHLQADADAVTRLLIGKHLSEGEASRIRAKLSKRVAQLVRPRR